MKQATIWILVMFWSLAVQAEDDTTTYYTNGLVNTVVGTINVGNSGTNNYWEVSGATTLTNSGNVRIGNTTAAHYNTARISGANSAWINAGDLYVGFAGSFNQLLIQAGGVFTTATDTVVGNGSSSSNNLLSVTGTGSIYKGSGLYAQGGVSNTLVAADGGKIVLSTYVGQSGVAAQVLVTNGGVVQTSAGFRLGETAAAFGQRILIDGSGSRWTNTASTSNIGRLSSNSLLQVQNSGRVDLTGSLFIGGNGAGSLGSSNRALIADTGSTLRVTGDLYVGHPGNQNQLLIENGAGASVSGDTVIGNGSAANNLIFVSGAGSTFTGVSVYAQGGLSNNLAVGDGGKVVLVAYVGQSSVGAQVLVTNGGVIQTSASFRLGETAAAFGQRILIDGSGSRWTNTSSTSYIGRLSSNSVLQLQNSGRLDQTGNLIIGGGHNNTATIAGTGSMLRVTGELYVGNPGNQNQLLIQNGGAVTVSGDSVVGNSTGADNLILVTGAGSTYTAPTLYAQGGSSNNLVVTEGGKAIITAYHGQSSVGAQVLVTNGGVVQTTSATLGVGAGANYQRILVDGSGSVWSNSGILRIGQSGLTNTLEIHNRGEVIAGTVQVGTVGTGNKVVITSDGLLEANTLTVGAAAGNVISNNGGVFQFTTTAPALTPGSGGISVNSATVSFYATTGDVLPVAGMTYSGANTFRLNAATNAAAGQAYTFQVVAGNPTNYVNLAMVNGHTRYQGGNLTIGSTGSMLVSNTTASVSGLFTNNGSLSFVNARATYASRVYNSGTSTMLNSVGTFNTGVINAGRWETDPTTNVFQGFGLTNTISGVITMAASDVYIFSNTVAGAPANFVNVSTNKAASNTATGKFLFSGGLSLTQTFYAAGLDQGPVAATATSVVTAASGHPGFTANFALGTLEISNFSTVRVSDAFITLGPGANDGLLAGLYLENLFMGANSLLIIDTNVQVYFKNSNNWTSANFILEGNGTYDNSFSGLHQITIIPEPSVLLLCLAGCGTVWAARRRKRR